MSFTSIIKIIYGNTYTSYKSNFHLGQQLFSSFSCISARILYDYILDWGDNVLPWGTMSRGTMLSGGTMSGGTMSRGQCPTLLVCGGFANGDFQLTVHCVAN